MMDASRDEVAAHQEHMDSMQMMQMGMGGGYPQAQMGGMPINSPGAAALGGMPGQMGGGAKSSRICRHFIRGRCTWGAQCRFSHDPSALAQQQSLEMAGGMGGYAEDMGYGRGPMGRPAHGLHPSLQHRMHGSYDMGAMQPPAPRDTNRVWLGEQQATLQMQRNTILSAAVQARFQIATVSGGEAVEGPNGKPAQRGQVVLLGLTSAPEIMIHVYDEDQVKCGLEQLEADPRVAEGGLHYLIGEGSVFWSMMRNWHVSGSTTSPKWDAILRKAISHNRVDCMFYHTNVGCCAAQCGFDHVVADGPAASGMSAAGSQQGADERFSLAQAVPGGKGSDWKGSAQASAQATPGTAPAQPPAQDIWAQGA